MGGWFCSLLLPVVLHFQEYEIDVGRSCEDDERVLFYSTPSQVDSNT